MAKSYIHELGDRLSNGFTADSLPKHIKEIAPIMYNDGSNNFNSIQSALNGKAESSHTHGNIQNGGTLQTNDITIANGDKLVVTDSSDSSKVARASIAFDGSTATKALTQKGTWETFNNYSHPAGSAPSKTGVPTANASPGFGGTFKVNQITTDSTSHVSAVTERTITIPNATATTSAAGLMSAADKTKLNNAMTKKTGFAYRGTSGGPAYKIAEKTFTKKTVTHSEQLVFDVSYSTHPTAIATSRLVASFRVDANTSATMGFLTNTVIRWQGFTELPFKFYGAVDYTNGKFTLYAKYISGAYVTVEAECILASSENTDLIDNVSVFNTTTAELPETSKEETTIWVANTSASSGTAPVKVDAYGTLTAVPMDSTPTASSTNLMTSGGIKTALDGKASTSHAHDDRYIRASSGNKSLSFGGTTTIGTVQGNNVNLVMPEADSDIYYVSANVTSFSDVLAAFNSKQKLILQIGFEVSDTATAAYNIPLNRIIFSDDIPSTFTWVYTQDRLQGDANRGAITTWSLGSSGWESHSEFTYYADTAGLSNKASALIDFGNTNKMTRVGWEGNSIGKVIASGSSQSLSESSYLAAYYVADGMGHVKDVKAANVQVGSAKSVNADAGESISSTGTNGSMEILNGALTSLSGEGGSCSIDGDGISFTQGVSGSSMTASSIATAGTGTFTGGANAKGRPIDGSATIVTNSSLTWNSATTHLVVNRSAASTTTIDLKNLLEGVVYWLHVPRDNTIHLKNSSAISTFYCYDKAFTTTKTTDTLPIRSEIRAGSSSHGGFSTAIIRSKSNFYVMMEY